jgi:hypothetical protein
VSWVVPLLIALLTIPLVVALLRANELFALRWQAGKLKVVRGRIPQALLGDIRDVLRDCGAPPAELRGVVEDGRAVIRLRAQDLPSQVNQRLRNTISLWPVAKIRNAPKRR